MILDTMIEADPQVTIAAIWERLADEHQATVAYPTLRTYVSNAEAWPAHSLLVMDANPADLVRFGYNALSHHYRSDDDAAREYDGWLADLRDRLPRSSHVLDIGCGCGIPVARHLTAAGHQVTGIDISDIQIERARQLVPGATFIRADATELDFPPGSFDTVTCLYALIHMPLDRQPRLLHNIARWLRPGGWLLATTGVDAWTGTQDNWLGGPAAMWWSHADAATYRSWIRQAGLEITGQQFIPEGNSGHALFWARQEPPELNRKDQQLDYHLQRAHLAYGDRSGLSFPMLQERTMDNEIQLISDGDGLAVIGDPAVIESFLVSEGLSSKDLGLPRLQAVLSTGAAAAQAGSEIAANSGRWVKLTKESAQLVSKYGLRKSSKTGLSTGVVKGDSGQVKAFVEFARGPGSLLANPALLAGAAGIMAQVAMQQTMDEIIDYLATIDEKLDDVLRAQEDAVLADMIGAGFDIDEAMTIREHAGRVNEVTWSKVQATSATIARTQAYALRQLDALAEKMERKTKIGDLATMAKEAESKIQGWLVVLARCFQLQDAIAVLELDRVLDAVPDDLDGHRLGLKASRQKRLDTISRSTERLMARMDAAAGTANAKVLLHPTTSAAVVQSRKHVASAVDDFHERLGIESGRQSLEAKRWVDAVSEVRDKVLETGAERVDVSRRLGNEALDRARSVQGRLSSGIGERALRRRGGEDEERDEQG